MVQQGQIDNLLRESGQIPAPHHVSAQAALQDYDGVYARSIEDPEGFWAEAAEGLHWFRRWDQVFQWEYPNFRWFVGGQTNICYNALDVHLTTERRNKAALIWLGEDGTEQVYTYARLAQQVNRCANGLKSLGIGKGDRVVIYMPLTPRAPLPCWPAPALAPSTAWCMPVSASAPCATASRTPPPRLSSPATWATAAATRWT